MSNAQTMYALNLDQIATAIRTGGNKRTILVQGHMGTGKSSLVKMLAADLPTHTPCYFDCTTKDLGDITIPNLAKLDDGTGYVTYLTNEELGAHLNTPIILMVDEYGKANPAVKNAMLRLMLERKIGSYTLHPDSLVFATTNLGGWCKDNPHLFASFEDVKDPEENPYIYHPRDQRTAFVTPRSLEAASDWLKEREAYDDQTLTGLLMGTIGARGAMPRCRRAPAQYAWSCIARWQVWTRLGWTRGWTTCRASTRKRKVCSPTGCALPSTPSSHLL